MERNGIWMLMLVFGFVTCVTMSVSLAAEEITITGVLERSNRQNYLATNNEKYKVIGQDFSRLIGKRLKVTGDLTTTNSGKTVLVKFMEIVSN